MSSLEVRQALNAAVASLAAPWQVFDMSEYHDLDEILTTNKAEVVLVQYVIAGDDMQTIGGDGNQGWEETGSVTLMMAVPTGFASESVVQKGDTIRKGLRGRRISGDTLVESCTPFVDFGAGGVNGAVHLWASNLFYSRRDCG